MEDGNLLFYQLLSDGRCNLADRQVGGDQSHPKVALHQNHQGLLPLAHLLLNVLSMAGEVELLGVDGMFVDGGRDEHVNPSILILLQGTLQCGQGSLTGFGVRFGELHLHLIIAAVHDTQPIGLCFGS